MIRVALVDDHSLFRRGMKLLLSSYPEIEVVVEAASGKEFLAVLDQTVISLNIRQGEQGGESIALSELFHSINSFLLFKRWLLLITFRLYHIWIGLSRGFLEFFSSARHDYNCGTYILLSSPKGSIPSRH